MMPVIIGKSKTATVEPMPSNLLVVGGSFTGRLKIYDRDTLQVVTGVDTSAMTSINSLAYDADYIYVGGAFPTSPYARKISRTTKEISNLASGAPNTKLGKNCIAVNGNEAYTAPYGDTAGRVYKFDIAGGTATYIAQPQYTYYDISYLNGFLYLYLNYRFTSFWIRKMATNPFSAVATITLTGNVVRSVSVDSNFLYFGSTTSGDFHVYDLDLTTEQTGYPTIPGGIYSILNDDMNVYIGSDSGKCYVINKATKALTTIDIGGSSAIKSMSATDTHLYVMGTYIHSVEKANFNNRVSIKQVFTGTNTIMVI